MSAGSAFSVTPASMARRPQLRSVAGESGNRGCRYGIVWDMLGVYMVYGIWQWGNGACGTADWVPLRVCVFAGGRGEINVL